MNQRIPSDFVNQVSRYNHNISGGEFGTVHACLAIPSKFRHMNIGDRVRGRFATLVQSEPFQGPVMQGFNIYTIATFTPDSVIHGWQDNGQDFTPEQMLNFDYWLYSALYPYASAYDNNGDENYKYLSPLGYWDFTHDGPVGDFDETTYPFGTVGSTVNRSDTPFITAVGLGGLWDWLGVPAGATPQHLLADDGRTPKLDYAEYQWPLMPVVAYALSCIYYFRNLQEKNMYFTKGVRNMEDTTMTGFDDVFVSVSPNEILSAVEYLHYHSRHGNVYNANLSVNSGGAYQGGWQYADENANILGTLATAGLDTYGGLFAIPYSPDLFNNLIKLGDSPVASCPLIQTESGDAIAIPDLRAANKEQLMLDRLFASGGRWDDVRRALFGKKGSTATTKPQFLGAWRSRINPINQVATSAGQGSDGIVDLGQMGARTDSFSDYGGQEEIDFFAEEAGTLMFISCIVPDPAYSQGLNPDLYSRSWADDFNPEQNGAGFQTVPRSRYSMLPNSADWFNADSNIGTINDDVVGEEVAWSWLRTDFSRLHGQFSSIGDRQYWTIHRDFTMFNRADFEFYGDNITTYANPMDVQYLFTGQAFEYANFRLMADFKLSITNQVSDHYMPFLGR